MALEPVPSIPPVVVIAHDDPGTADSLRHAVEAAGWQALLADPSASGLTAALAAGPSVALVACAALTDLPADCPVPLIAIGDDDQRQRRWDGFEGHGHPPGGVVVGGRRGKDGRAPRAGEGAAGRMCITKEVRALLGPRVP